MKKKEFEIHLEMQYSPIAKKYSQLHLAGNERATTDFFEMIMKHSKSTIKVQEYKSILDLGCGAATDAPFYDHLKFEYFGIDSSKEMCELARKNIAHLKYCSEKGVENIRCADFSNAYNNLKREDRPCHSIVVSKWALQTTLSIDNVYEQVFKVLECPNQGEGEFYFLVVHPLRQFLEKKKSGKNYFRQEIVNSRIFDKKITVYEPSHTLQDYITPYFLERFELIEIKEGYEFPAAEQIKGDVYPTYLIVAARNRFLRNKRLPQRFIDSEESEVN